ncbi:MAG TPA: transketolase C-terminal domain-containing protein [Opitutus sp.]|nr:transketolase C-terminal domain-containing protein [Opitutus sp.]
MRAAFVRALLERARADRRVVLLTGDIGFGVVEEFATALPDRFVNAGVAEQNMIAVATGLAASGLRPFVYSIAPFVSARPYEALRNGPALHRLPVRVVGVGGGFDYGAAGFTHHAFDDIALMRALPGFSTIAPASDQEAVEALHATWDTAGPVYFRLAKDPAPPAALGPNTPPYSQGEPRRLREGDELVLVATGRLVVEACAAAVELAQRGRSVGVVHVPRLAPLDGGELDRALGDAALVITVEDHAVSGGLGTLVSEVVASGRHVRRVIRCGMDDPRRTNGASPALLRACQLDAAGLAATALRALETQPT